MADGRLVISVRVGRTFDDYDTEAQWRGAIEDGALRPDTVVTVARGDEPQFSTHARDVPELAGLFEAILGVGLVTPISPEPQVDEHEGTTDEGQQNPLPPGTQDGVPPEAVSRGEAEVIIPDLGGQSPPPPPPPPLPLPGPGKPKSEDRGGWRHPFVIAGSVLIVLLLVLRFVVGVDLPSIGNSSRSSTADSVEAQPVTVYTVRNVNLRAWPSRNATGAGELARGVELRGVWVEGEGDQWLRITEGVHAGAHVLGNNVNPNRPPQLRGTAGTMQVMLASEIYTHPDAGAGTGVIRSLAPGDTVSAVGETDSGWVEVTVEGRGVGYVPAMAFVAPQPPPEEAYDLAAEQAAAAAAAAVRECRQRRTVERGVEMEQTYCREADGRWVPSGRARPTRSVTTAGDTDASAAETTPPAQGVPPYILGTNWIAEPNLSRYHPGPAMAAGQGGKVSLDCGINTSGRAHDCRILSDSNPGYGFAQAAQRASGDLRMPANDARGRPTAGRRVLVTFTWREPTDEP